MQYFSWAFLFVSFHHLESGMTIHKNATIHSTVDLKCYLFIMISYYWGLRWRIEITFSIEFCFLFLLCQTVNNEFRPFSEMDSCWTAPNMVPVLMDIFFCLTYVFLWQVQGLLKNRRQYILNYCRIYGLMWEYSFVYDTMHMDLCEKRINRTGKTNAQMKIEGKQQ